jgi:DNA repair exonuclease SbcCD ATPase subunit
MAEKLRELARRQDELLRRQQVLQNLPEEERKRELETLTREQAALREQAEDLAKSSRNGSSPNASAQMRDIARDMQGATNDLRRQDSKSSQSRGRQALEKLQRMTQPGQQPDKKETGPGRLEDALAKARGLREKLDALTREIQQPGHNGDRKRLQQDAERQLQQVQELIDQLRREEPALSSGGPGFTYEGQGMTFSAPGTEAFKQDFSRWQQLRDQATRALDRLSAAVTKKLDEQGRRDRLAAGVDDKAPPAYRSRVDEYFKAIAGKKPQ